MGNQVDTRVYLYQTDFNSERYNQLKYNENYRSYFHCKYTQNPRFIYFTDALREKSLPLVKTCCEFIPRVYYISAKNIEGSVIPYVIQQDDKTRNDHRKNFIIGDDSLLNFKKWVNYPRILELCNLIVARRIYDYSRLKLFSDDIISKLGYGKISIMECPIFDASSSDIRNALQNGINPVGLDENVFEYIKTHKLYGWCEH